MTESYSPTPVPTVNGVPFDRVLATLTRPVSAADLAFRQQGKVSQNAHGFSALFVPYVEAWLIRQRLDEVACGRWSLTTTDLGTGADLDGEAVRVLEATLAIRCDDGAVVARSGVGEGTSAKAAASDAIKRAGVRFGIGEELYRYPKVWVKMQSAEKYAKPAEDPEQAFRRACQKAGILVPGSQADASTPRQPDKANHQPEESLALTSATAELRKILDAAEFTDVERAGMERWLTNPKNQSVVAVETKAQSALRTLQERRQQVTQTAAAGGA